jgi:hypothetical protein
MAELTQTIKTLMLSHTLAPAESSTQTDDDREWCNSMSGCSSSPTEGTVLGVLVPVLVALLAEGEPPRTQPNPHSIAIQILLHLAQTQTADFRAQVL